MPALTPHAAAVYSDVRRTMQQPARASVTKVPSMLVLGTLLSASADKCTAAAVACYTQRGHEGKGREVAERAVQRR